MADKFEEIKERAKRGRYGGHTGSLTVLRYEDVTWLFREIERLREDNKRLQLLLRTTASTGEVRPTNLGTDPAQ